MIRRMARTLGGLLVACPLAGAQEGFEAALALVGEGRLPAALSAADAELDPVRRAQARLFVLHHAGDLSGALEAGQAGLEVTEDPWLLERSTYIALSLRAAARAGELHARFEKAVAGAVQSAAEEGRMRALVEDYGRQCAELAAGERALEGALVRARVAILSVLIAAACALGFLPRRASLK